MHENVTFIIIGCVVIFGFLATTLYYFIRYYIRTHEVDQKFPGHRDSDSLPPPPPPGSTSASTTTSTSTPTSLPPTPTTTSTSIQMPTSAPEIHKKDLREALSCTRTHLWGRIKTVIDGEKPLSEDDMESLEEILYTSDLGPRTVQRLVESVGKSLTKSEKSNIDKVRKALQEEMALIFQSLNHQELDNISQILRLQSGARTPHVWMVVGVNGVGKTTTIGKLAHQVVQGGKKVMVVAGDTFRAAADAQLKVWSERAQVELFSPSGVKDPSAVAFDACTSAQSKGFDVVIVDTAGRLHTQEHLVQELQKMKRVIQKVLPEAPHEVLVVLDANSGQNALAQARSFNEAMGLTGAILTKLDGSAKGGVAVGLACELQLPIKMIGVGEGLEDLRTFDSKEFVESII